MKSTAIVARSLKSYWSSALIAIAFLTVLATGSIYWIGQPFREIDRLEYLYLSTKPGMTLAVVESIMGKHSRIKTAPFGAWWDDQELGAAASATIAQEMLYTVETFYLPVSFSFSFDGEGRLVGRHRYD